MSCPAFDVARASDGREFTRFSRRPIYKQTKCFPSSFRDQKKNCRKEETVCVLCELPIASAREFLTFLLLLFDYDVNVHFFLYGFNTRDDKHIYR